MRQGTSPFAGYQPRNSVVSQFDESAQSVGRVARLSRNVCQPNHVLGNQIAGHQAERRPGAGEEWPATTEHDGVEVDSILVNQSEAGQASCQDWSGNLNFPSWLHLQLVSPPPCRPRRVWRWGRPTSRSREPRFYRGSSACGTKENRKKVGWEAWTRTRIIRSRI